MLYCPLVSSLVRRKSGKQSPESGAVVGMPDMAELMEQHVLHKFRVQKHEVAVEAQSPDRGHAGPSGLLFSNLNPGNGQLMLCGQGKGTGHK
jgi:hypothetical protein